jgi:ArsR family transcriptional regulator, virulence genes transcriptional regulator
MQRRNTMRNNRNSKPLPATGIEDLRDNATQAARLLRALSNENRLLLLCLLYEGERTVGELNESLPLSQSALSQHLAVLRDEELVSTRRSGQSIYYGLASSPAQRVIETLHAIYCPERC